MGKILISACLVGKRCRYDGESKPNKEIIDFCNKNEVILVCPETLGGLTIPREPSEIQEDKVISRNGHDVTKEFKEGAMKALEIALDNGVTLAILKARSPSCGHKEVYDGSFTGTLVKGEGLFARMCRENGIEVIDEEEFKNR